MKQTALKYPFTWEERKPYFSDAVLFVPDYYFEHKSWNFPGWKALFGTDHPVAIEYCSGNGTWIAEKAKNFPLMNWVAVEWRFERVRKIWSKIKNYGLSNLIVICGEALTFTREYVPDQSVDEVYVNFPDPWPKEKHASNRLFQPPFIKELTRTLQKGATITVVTDDLPYAQQIQEVVLQAPFTSMFPSPYYVTEWEGYGTSYFDALWRSKGKNIHYFHFRRKELP